jgi:hypothetical protein
LTSGCRRRPLANGRRDEQEKSPRFAARAFFQAIGPGMIRKSAKRFSEKIMPKQKFKARWRL